MGILPHGGTVASPQFIYSFNYISVGAWILVIIHHIRRISVYSVAEIRRPLGVLWRPSPSNVPSFPAPHILTVWYQDVPGLFFLSLTQPCYQPFLPGALVSLSGEW